MLAKVIPAGGADAVPSPVPEGADELVQQRVVGIHRAAFPHGHVVRGIEAGGADVPDGAGELFHPVDGVFGA